jgi:hypothetical protein
MTTPEPGLIKEAVGAATKVVEVVTRPLKVLSEAAAVRLEILLRRKPRLFVNLHPGSARWCLARSGNTHFMQVMFSADLSHDDPEQKILLIDAYFSGTKPRVRFTDPVAIPGNELLRTDIPIHFWVAPVIGEEGKNFSGHVIFIDQWHRKYKTNKFEFVWAGAPVSTRPHPAN